MPSEPNTSVTEAVKESSEFPDTLDTRLPHEDAENTVASECRGKKSLEAWTEAKGKRLPH